MRKQLPDALIPFYTLTFRPLRDVTVNGRKNVIVTSGARKAEVREALMVGSPSKGPKDGRT